MKELISKWKRKSEGIRYEPPIDYRIVFNELVKNLSNKKHSFLDIGTGTGKVIFGNNLQEKYGKVVGIDIESEMIEICKEKSTKIQNAEFLVMDSTKKMSFPDKSFDVVVVMFAPYNIQEVYRLLKPEGYFILLWGFKGDHKELTDLFPEIFDLWDKRLYFETVEERKMNLECAGLKMVGNNILNYKWVFRDRESLKEFYEKILLTKIFDGKEERLSKLKELESREIPVTRIIGTTIAKKS